MNSTRTWVTPPLEPVITEMLANVQLYLETHETRTSTAEDFDDLHKLDGDFASIHLGGRDGDELEERLNVDFGVRSKVVGGWRSVRVCACEIR